METKESVLPPTKACELGCWILLTESKRHSLLPPFPYSSKNSCSRALGRGSASAVGGGGRHQETLGSELLLPWRRAGSPHSASSVRVTGSILGLHRWRWGESGPAGGVSEDVAPLPTSNPQPLLRVTPRVTQASPENYAWNPAGSRGRQSGSKLRYSAAARAG